MPSSTVENYLKAILHLQDAGDGTVTVGEIARELDVTPGTVTTMMRHLSDQKLIDYAPRRGLKLLPEGQAFAMKVVRRHRLIELFLVDVLKLDWSEVHEEAEILEHVVSDRLLDRIDAMLDHPTHDPHGDPIPDRHGKIVRRSVTPLAEVIDGRYRIARVSDEDSALLGWLDQKGLNLGEEISLTRPDQAAGLLEVATSGGDRVQMGINVAERVFVESV